MKKNGIKLTWNFDIFIDGEIGCSYISDNDSHLIFYGDEVITKSKTITIIFDYPLDGKFPMVFKSRNGFTRAKFYECVYRGYQKIYKSEDKYGVWGHCIGDLSLGYATEISPGKFELGIDS